MSHCPRFFYSHTYQELNWICRGIWSNCATTEYLRWDKRENFYPSLVTRNRSKIRQIGLEMLLVLRIH